MDFSGGANADNVYIELRLGYDTSPRDKCDDIRNQFEAFKTELSAV